MGREKKLNKVKISYIPIDYQLDIVQMIFKKDIDFLFENEHSAFHREQQSRYPLQSRGSSLTCVFSLLSGLVGRDFRSLKRR
jgi:hypothetical protein